ncbi:MAG: S8/S53 family peptidase [Bacteroidia bacterium]
MKKYFTQLLLLVFVISNSQGIDKPKQHFRLALPLSSSDYIAGKIILKVKPQFRNSCFRSSVSISSLNERIAVLNVERIEKIFPSHQPPSTQTNSRGQKMADLSLIYELTFNPNIPIEKAVNILLQDEAIEYAEPKYNTELLYTPNDTLLSLQYQLVNIHALQGWDISKGDTNIVIGITDTGTDIDHPDLINQVKYNYADPINGIDDDGDGYIDNYMGWDLGDNDNDPTVAAVHGSFVSGCSSAQADNITGIAGSGYNCKYLPVKIAQGFTLTKAYEGIVYAADHGCQIINCSWGSFGGGQFGQDIVDYATINQNRLVIAASGNSNNEDPFYPASYKYVLGVTGTNSADVKWANSSYGCTVDVSAPGESVYSTIFDDSYTSSSGTSFSSPIVCGLAGIVMSHFPALNPLQVAEQVRATCDNIDTIAGNAAYIQQLGKGRVNLFRALTETTAKSVRMDDMVITDNNDNAFAANDTLEITGIITNWLSPITGLTMTITCSSPDVTILDGTVNIASMATLATTDNNSDPFTVKISPLVPLNTDAMFTISYTDGAGYTDFQCFHLVVNVDYINVLINDVGTSITSKGRIGYNAPNQSQGIGFTYNGSGTTLYESSLLIGDWQGRVSDRMIGSPVTVNDTDFTAIENVRELTTNTLSDFDLYGTFNDDGAGGNKMDVKVTQRTYAWSTPADAKYIIIYYTYTNNGAATLNNFYGGIYCDWDIGAITNNRAATDAANKLGYAWEDITNGIYVGVKVLGVAPFNCYAFDNNGANGSFSIYDGFTKAEKYNSMSGPRSNAGTGGAGNDVSAMVASGPYSINAGDSIKVGFALIGGDNLADIIASAQAADVKFNTTITVPEHHSFDFSFSQSYPNPFSGTATVSITLPAKAEVELNVFDLAGKLVKTIEQATLAAGTYNYTLNSIDYSHGIYFLKLKAGDRTEVRKFVVTK